jgi:hypothetical protein
MRQALWLLAAAAGAGARGDAGARPGTHGRGGLRCGRGDGGAHRGHLPVALVGAGDAARARHGAELGGRRGHGGGARRSSDAARSLALPLMMVGVTLHFAVMRTSMGLGRWARRGPRRGGGARLFRCRLHHDPVSPRDTAARSLARRLRDAKMHVMIVELGHFALLLALLVACVQMVVPLVGADRGWRGWMAVGEPAATAQFLLLLFSFAALTWAFVTSDFSVRLVTANSHTDKPMIYKITGVWGNHEGSMLLWVLILALFGAMAGWFGGNLPDRLQGPRAGRAGRGRRRLPRLHDLHLEPVPAARHAALQRAGPEPAPAGPGPRLPPAVPLRRLCRASRSPSPSRSPR